MWYQSQEQTCAAGAAGSEETGWDGVGGDGMGWDRMRLDGVGEEGMEDGSAPCTADRKPRPV